jgi:hypothetical protein
MSLAHPFFINFLWSFQRIGAMHLFLSGLVVAWQWLGGSGSGLVAVAWWQWLGGSGLVAVAWWLGGLVAGSASENHVCVRVPASKFSQLIKFNRNSRVSGKKRPCFRKAKMRKVTKILNVRKSCERCEIRPAILFLPAAALIRLS